MKVILNVLLMVALLTLSACSPKQADAPKNTQTTTATEAKTQTESKTEGQTTPSKKSETTSQSDAKGSVENPLDPSLYAPITKFEKTVSPSKIVWKENDTTLTANITTTKAKNVPGNERTLINSWLITKGDQKFTLPTTDKEGDPFRDIESISLSPSHTWLAIQAQRSAGNTLILLNLKTGKSTSLNDLLMSKGNGYIEAVRPYNWSPKDDQIAFSFGDTDKSSIAIYDTKKDSILYLPRETDYTSTNLILWHKNSKYLDYISEYPSDQKKLYRYSLDSKQVQSLAKISRSEFQEWSKLDKYK